MGASYHQFCPVAKAMELLDERWTLLVIRELLYGSRHFSALRRGVPTMSPTLLSRRLQQLVRAGVPDRTEAGREVTYTLTPAGEELRPVVEALAVWGTRWIGELGDPDLDPRLLVWDLHRNVDPATVPPGRTVVEFRFPDAAASRRRFWLVLTPEEVDVCDLDPGFGVEVSVTGPVRALVGIWRGDLSWSEALRSDAVRIDGSAALRRAVPRWFPPSRFAGVPRPEQRAS